jgi:mersacidin/lichenicidin family type 2 lantibiotic
MSNKKVIRAWKDPVYRNSLSEAERAALPANPAGSIEISDADLGKVAGGLAFHTIGCHTGGYCTVTAPRCM